MEWQPIATAPKDGTRILLYRPNCVESMAVCWRAKDWHEWWIVFGPSFHGATHWMPLPTPPDDDTSDGGVGGRFS